MINNALHLLSSSFTPVSPADRNCPICNASYLYRTKRRMVDRILSQLIPVRRYHCERCGWVGNLRVKKN